MKNFKQFVTEHQNKFFLALLVIWVISLIGLIVYMHLDLKRNEQKAKEAVEQLVDAMDKAAHPMYDTCYTYVVEGYRVDVMYNDTTSYCKMVFRYLQEPDMFVVNISPAFEYKQYEADIISRFISVHNNEKCTSYEYYIDSTGKEHRELVAPITEVYNVYIAYHLEPGGKTKTPFLRRKGTEFGYKLK